MPTKSAPVSALLDLAADLMEVHGWQIGNFFEVDSTEAINDENVYVGGRMCTEGAIRAASTLIWSEEMRRNERHLGARRRETLDAYQAVSELIPHSNGVDSIYCIPWWNDTQCCSKEEAVQVLRDAATKTRPDQ